MPQLVKGGKYVFGWIHVNPSGKICIPEEAREEYQIHPFDKVIIINGSRSSKGFAVTKIDWIKNSPMFKGISKYTDLIHFRDLENGFIKEKNRIYTWTEADRAGNIQMAKHVLCQYSVSLGDHLLAIRGSGFALGFIKTGMIVEEALKHPELKIYS